MVLPDQGEMVLAVRGEVQGSGSQDLLFHRKLVKSVEEKKMFLADEWEIFLPV